MSPTEPRHLSTEEKIIVALACLIALSFFLFLPRSCQMGATALNVRNFIPDSERSGISASGLGSSEQAEESKLKTSQKEKNLATATAKDQAEDARLLASRESGNFSSSAANSQRASGQSAGSNQLGVSKASLATAAAVATTLPDNQAEEDLKKLSSALDRRTREISEQEEQLLSQKELLTSQGQQLMAKEQEIANLQNLNKEAKDGFDRAQSNLESENLSLKEKLAQLEEQLANNPTPEANPDMPESTEATPDSGEEATPEEDSGLEMPLPENEEDTSATGNETESSFAESEADLDEARKNLVLAIRDMESLRDSDLDNRYKELSTSLNANSLARINFSSGKSELKSAEAAKIVALAQEANPGSQFLVAGFADMSGTKAGNATLSSARAKVTANFLGSKVGYDKVSAIYLGQTARFGPKSKNRVVEIWELKASQ